MIMAVVCVACRLTPAQVPHVGELGPNRYLNPVGQILTPAGIQVDLPGLRPQTLALSPDGRLLVTSGKTHELVVVDPQSGEVLQHVPLPSDKVRADASESGQVQPALPSDEKAQVSYTGLCFSPDGSRIYLSNVMGSIKVFAVDARRQVTGLFSVPLPRADAPGRKEPIPAGLAISADGGKLYVCLNLSNRLAEIDLATHRVTRLWNVGVAPYDVVLLDGKAYVTNWGGRRPEADSLTGPAGEGTRVRVDPVRHIASEGSVTVIDLAAHRTHKEVLVGLHASAMALAPDHRYLVIANAGSDTLSVLDTQTDQIVETIATRLQPAGLFGNSPNALAFNDSGSTLFVANGTQNAIGVVRFQPGQSKLFGLIPVGWFPGALAYDAPRRRLHIANIKGVADTRKIAGTKPEFNTHECHGTLSLVPIPSRERLQRMTRTVLANAWHARMQKAGLPARVGQPPRPVPERVGEPSVFEHVVYIIKENRTYDQVLGDEPRGNANSSLCIFGKKITPNQHKIVDQFVLLDNTYCSGILSADGHQWSDAALATDYLEKSFTDFPRSYPDGMEDDDVDALAYAPSGFIWDNAVAHDKRLRIYGEFAITETKWKQDGNSKDPTFLDYYRDFVGKTDRIEIRSRPAIESIRPYLAMHTVGWDMDIPDVFRAAQFIRELHQFEERETMPHLMIICLPNDHTSGTRYGSPTPAAQVADNDLAFGQIVDALSHSRFWKKTCIFAIEDDPQAGWDHVSGFRTTAYVISPYTKRHAVVSRPYTQPSLLRTIELVLGLPPMNRLDAAAEPMDACFTDTPDWTPFTVAPNNVPLDQMNPNPKKISDASARRWAIASAELPLDEVDRCPEDLLNRILWHAMKGPETPYPNWAVSADADDD